jgi:DNA-binding LytR/AlgR family response regulator
VLADDERLMREQLRARLAEAWPSCRSSAEAKNGAEGGELVEQHRPDVVFLDIRMPGMTGVDAARQIAQMDVGDDELPARDRLHHRLRPVRASRPSSRARPTTSSSPPSATA